MKRAGFWKTILTTDDENTIFGLKRAMTVSAFVQHSLMTLANGYFLKYFQVRDFCEGVGIILGTYLCAVAAENAVPIIAQKIADMKKPDQEKP